MQMNLMANIFTIISISQENIYFESVIAICPVSQMYVLHHAVFYCEITVRPCLSPAC